MVREFTLVDGNGEEYSLTNEERLLFDPSGLGFERENTYRQVGNRFILANSVPVQSVIEGTVCFTPPDAYFNYQEFVEFCGRDGLKMEYRLGEMASRKTKRLTGNVIWTDFAGNQYAGMYNFITGDYLLTEKIIECDENTIINTESSFASGQAVLYSIDITERRNTADLTYCNGIPASNHAMTTLSVEFSNNTFTGGVHNKIYFSLHNDALQGKTIQQWFSEHDVKFSYRLYEPISGVNTTYVFNPKLMYNPMVSFASINDNNLTVPSNGDVSYTDINQEAIYLEGNNLILENTELNQELDSLIIYREIQNKKTNGRFEFVGTGLISSTNYAALKVGDNTSIIITPTNSSQSFPFDTIYTYSSLPLGYVSSGPHFIHYAATIEIMCYYGSASGTASGSVNISAKPLFVKSDGNSSYSVIVEGTNVTSGFNYDASGSKRISLSFYGTLGFSSEVNSIIYPQINTTVNISGLQQYLSAKIVSFKFTSCSLQTSGTIPTGPINVLDLTVFPGKSIAQVSQADSQHYQRAVRLNKIEKTELTKTATLETEVEFECLEPWGDPFSANVEHGTSPDPVNSISINSDSHSLSPCDLYISGPCTNPTWSQTVNGVEVTTGGYTGTIASGEQLLIRAKDGACGIYLINGSGNTDDVYKYSDFSKDRFVYIRYGDNVITVTDGANATNQLDCYIEGDLYYESV